jgi:hypothetical protein
MMQSVKAMTGQQDTSLLTTEEQEALKPNEVRVDNPWIFK